VTPATKQLLGGIAIALTVTAFVPYVVSILRHSVRPHVFSWVIWGITTSSVFVAALHEGGGSGAWPIGASACITFAIAGLAFSKRGDLSITKADWLFFIAALSALPLWFLTNDPLWAVVVLTMVDLLGFGPTLRKAAREPHSESATFFGLFVGQNAFVLLALESYSVTTVLFPAAIGTASAAVVVLILLRRAARGVEA